jgi:hypothetical protein
MSRLCECGCGRATKPAARTIAANQTVKGFPQRFIKGHSGGPDPPITVQQRAYMAAFDHRMAHDPDMALDLLMEVGRRRQAEVLP